MRARDRQYKVYVSTVSAARADGQRCTAVSRPTTTLRDWGLMAAADRASFCRAVHHQRRPAQPELLGFWFDAHRHEGRANEDLNRSRSKSTANVDPRAVTSPACRRAAR
jgi:hypothetical protein